MNVLVAALLVASLAHADGVERRINKPDTPARLHAVTTMLPMENGGFVTVGFSTLRVLAPGAKQFTTVHRIPKDNLYRVASNEAGDVLAAWENDPSLHLFKGPARQHVTLPKPRPPTEEIRSAQVEYLAFLPNGRDALVHMEGRKAPRGEVSIVYRVPLDGGAPELLYRVDDARQLHMARDVAVYVIPERPGQMCEHLRCDPVRQVVAYELNGRGVKQTVLVHGPDMKLENARMIWGNRDGRIFLELSLPRNERAVLRWKPGQPKADVRPFARSLSSSERLFATNDGDVLRLLNDEEEALTLHRHMPDGRQQSIRLLASHDPDIIDYSVHALGMRNSGALWLHWGDFIFLFDRDLARPPRAYNIEPLLTRHTEWADVAVYVKEPEALWMGIEVRRSRDFVRVSFSELEKGAKAWNPVRAADTGLD
ncbi:hypothetical protein [Myxococcus sp. RHSTA-1-4]|uniref:hypothetical protein n=1 Tax=Myxococcus sp. RHSTA-1-4 TaxID=2874601 RepID=UPI001CBEA5FB|nr:hypothetical protein [Myxococcus sp. RHSTA-1-4]MBZ4415350.1 hypothetical protein [Myxococcus sp. RHSTA-1-4]